jgi:hypothetical protein
MITGIELISQWPIARGGFAEIYHGKYKGQDVAIKCWLIEENRVDREEVYKVS